METGFDIKAFMKEFERMKLENDKLQFYKTDYIAIAQNLAKQMQIIFDACKAIETISKEIDPARALLIPTHGRKPSTPREEIKEMVDTIYQKMQEGVHVTNDLLENMYPNYFAGTSKSGLFSMFKKRLEKLPKVQRRMDGNKVILYI